MNKEFWNDVASKGALLGVLMALSRIFELALVSNWTVKSMMIVGIEYIIVAVIYVWLLYRFAKRAASRLGSKERGFSYVQGLVYVLWVSIFAGVIAGLANYLYMHYVIGYGNFVAGYSSFLMGMMSATADMPSNLVQMVNEGLHALENSTEPSIFDDIISGINTYFLSGLVCGLFIAAGVKRGPEIFNDEES